MDRRLRALFYFGSAALTLALFTAGAASPNALALGAGPSYTEEQSTRGESVAAKSCTVCHGDQLKGDLAQALQGDDFLKNWKTAGELFDKITTTMPANDPGTLSTQQVADVIAYILKLNQFPAGPEALPSDAAALSAIALTK